jgi:molybdate transport system regulatory protein
MEETTGRGRAALVADGVEFDAEDATLLRAIQRTGSVASASSELGRSRARALSRIESLEASFGDLVERRRGGSGGGGSRLTRAAIQLLNRYDRLAAALTATAQVPETVLEGTVRTVTGELAAVETRVGTVRGLHDGLDPDHRVQVRIGADAITILDPTRELKPDSTSARNRRSGSVTDIERGETVSEISVDVSGIAFRALITAESASRLALERGSNVAITWKATATRLVAETNA